MNKILLRSTVLFLTLFVSVSWAASTDQPTGSTDKDKVARVKIDNKMMNLEEPSLKTNARSNAEAAAITFAQDSSNLSMKFGRSFGDVAIKAFVSLPLEEDQKEQVKLGDFDGLINSRTVGIEIKKINWPQITGLSKVQELCNSVIDPAEEAFKLAKKKFETAEAKFKEVKHAVDEEDAKLSDLLLARSARDAARSDLVSKEAEFEASLPCDERSFKNIVDQRTYEELTGYNKPISMFGLTAEAGREEFKYLDDMSLEEMESNETGYKGTVYWGRLSPTKQSFFSVGAVFQRSYTTSPKLQICNPIGTAGALSCRDQTVGAPKPGDRQIVYLEYRRRLSTFATAPKVSYDFDKDETGVVLPIWFATKPRDPSEEVQFRTGVRLDWNSESDDVVASLVFGGAFRLLN